MQPAKLVLSPLPNLLPDFTPEQAHAFREILERFLEAQEKDGMAGIEAQLALELPESNAKAIREEIEAEVKIYEDKQKSLEKALENGRTKEQWFASEIHKATQNLATQEVVPYLNSLDNAIKEANHKMAEALLTNEGVISQNPNLDGFIAEQQHVNRFNLNATARGSEYRAEVLTPEGRYTKNGVDIVVKNGEGKITQRHQLKYGQDAQSTKELFEKGDYRGQQKLVPSEQKAQLEAQGLKVTDKIEAPDGTTSQPLSKQEVKELQAKAQREEQIPQKTYNDYNNWDLVRGIGKESLKNGAYAGLFSLGIDLGAHICSNDPNKKLDKQKAQEMIQRALASGADTTLKSALVATLRVMAGKGLLPKIFGTKNVFVATANIIIDNLKVLYKYGKGEITGEQAIEKMHENALSTIAGIVFATAGELLFATIGAIFGPIGAVVGGFVGA
ncbi:hypothetical protein, partial [Helicobacter bizzozeronii]|uniref:hypothetical protein n=1 Tax=Helicobacter bizzozeronii TaxID=56877 RepID=UPI000CF112CC